MSQKITSVAVLGAGTMGSGIAGLCAENNCNVVLLDVSLEAAQKGLDRIINSRPSALDTPEKTNAIVLGSLNDDLHKISNCDWICEAIIEDLETKRTLMNRLEPLRKNGSIVSSNTSGIPLRDITHGMPDRLQQDMVITHFFNPVKIMKLLEIVPGAHTNQEIVDTLVNFCRDTLGKGVVHAKDTVNFIGNRIGCFWMLNGLHKALEAMQNGLTSEKIDALMSKPMGLPQTGLYGLIDLIGLDIMDLVGKNLAANLPTGDIGLNCIDFPQIEKKMLLNGQLGRKSGGGFYRVSKLDDGSKKKETFDLIEGKWRDFSAASLDEKHNSIDVLLSDDLEGQFCWNVMGTTINYAADLIPEIADDIVNIDRAMRWGFAWEKGPFQILDALGPLKIIKKLEENGQNIPNMLLLLAEKGLKTFYHNNGTEFLSVEGNYLPVPRE